MLQGTFDTLSFSEVNRFLAASRKTGALRMDAGVIATLWFEEGVFTADQSRRILDAAAAYGMTPRLHADELAPSGGAELAAELGALSADHLAMPSEAGIAALARAAETDRPVVATLLPATTWFLMKPETLVAPARTYIDAGIPVALGTDFFGMERAPKGFATMAELPNLTTRLVERGYADDVIRKVLGQNYLRIFGQVWR